MTRPRREASAHVTVLIRDEIERLRTEAGQTKSELARNAGITLRAYKNIANVDDPSDMKISTLYALCNALNVSIHFLFIQLPTTDHGKKA